MKALTGLSPSEFCSLVEPFRQGYQQHLDVRFPPPTPRQRRPGAGRKGKLPTPETKLFFLLYYFKTYPTFDMTCPEKC